jgi:hypothetical protein
MGGGGLARDEATVGVATLLVVSLGDLLILFAADSTGLNHILFSV